MSWRGPLLATGGCAIFLTLGFVILWPNLARKATDPDQEASHAIIEERITAGKKLMAQGRFHLARAALVEALSLRPPADLGRRLRRLSEQADALARLSLLPLEDIVRQARFVRDPGEWVEQWKQHQGRTLIFDDNLRRSPDGRPFLLNHRVRVEGEEVRLAWGEVLALRDLPLDDGPRVIFAVRLASCRREEGGIWVVRFAPNHGVLFTDAAALESAASVPLGENLLKVMQRQRRWAER